MSTMVRTIWIVTLAAAASVGVMAQPFDKLRAAPSHVEGQQPQAPVPSAAPTVQAGDTRPIHIYIRAGLKSHGEGLHDYPQFCADWSKLLTDHGALVDGSFHFPSAQELASTDVMVMYKGDAGYMTATERRCWRTTSSAAAGWSASTTRCAATTRMVLDDRRRRQEARRAELLGRRDQVHHRRQGVADHEGRCRTSRSPTRRSSR